MNVEKYNIFRVTTCQVRNNWNEVIFEPGQVLHAIMDLGWCWLARPVGSAATPRMLPKDECRELSETERALTGQWQKIADDQYVRKNVGGLIQDSLTRLWYWFPWDLDIPCHGPYRNPTSAKYNATRHSRLAQVSR